jgi:hypothetical protein
VPAATLELMAELETQLENDAEELATRTEGHISRYPKPCPKIEITTDPVLSDVLEMQLISVGRL